MSDAMQVSSRRRVNRKARQIVTLASQKGYSYDEIASICGVSVGSVKRWLSTGRADGDKIEGIEKLIGPVYLSPASVAEILDEIYRSRKKRFRLGRKQLKSLAGRSALKASFLEKVNHAMLDRGYYFVEAFGDDEDYFIVISIRQLSKFVPKKLPRNEIQQYYQTLSEEIVEEDEE